MFLRRHRKIVNRVCYGYWSQREEKIAAASGARRKQLVAALARFK